jgi:hypothetical protein
MYVRFEDLYAPFEHPSATQKVKNPVNSSARRGKYSETLTKQSQTNREPTPICHVDEGNIP